MSRASGLERGHLCPLASEAVRPLAPTGLHLPALVDAPRPPSRTDGARSTRAACGPVGALLTDGLWVTRGRAALERCTSAVVS